MPRYGSGTSYDGRYGYDDPYRSESYAHIAEDYWVHSYFHSSVSIMVTPTAEAQPTSPVQPQVHWATSVQTAEAEKERIIWEAEGADPVVDVDSFRPFSYIDQYLPLLPETRQDIRQDSLAGYIFYYPTVDISEVPTAASSVLFKMAGEAWSRKRWITVVTGVNTPEGTEATEIELYFAVNGRVVRTTDQETFAIGYDWKNVRTRSDWSFPGITVSYYTKPLYTRTDSKTILVEGDPKSHSTTAYRNRTTGLAADASPDGAASEQSPWTIAAEHRPARKKYQPSPEKLLGAMRIGHIWFDVPPTNISIRTRDIVEETPTLRTDGTLKTAGGNQQQAIDVVLFFPDKYSIENQLLPLLAMQKRTPFVPVENTFIAATVDPTFEFLKPSPGESNEERNRRIHLLRKKLDRGELSPSDFRVFVGIDGINVSTVPGFPRSLQAIVSMRVFNFIPFASEGILYAKTIKDAEEQIKYFKALSSGARPQQPIIDTTDDIGESEPFVTYIQNTVARHYRPFFPDKNGDIRMRYLWSARTAREMADEAQNTMNSTIQALLSAKDILVSVDKAKDYTQWLMADEDNAWNSDVIGTIRHLWESAWKLIHSVGKLAPNVITELKNKWEIATSEESAIAVPLLTWDPYTAEWKDVSQALVDILNTYRQTHRRNPSEAIEKITEWGRSVLQVVRKYLNEEMIPEINEEIVEFKSSEGRDIVVGVSITSQNNLKALPVAQYRLPILQHLSSSNVSGSITIRTKDLGTISEIKAMMDRLDHTRMVSNASKPSLARILRGKVRIDDTGNILNTFGVREIMVQDATYSTVEGQPGTFEIVIRFLQSNMPEFLFEHLLATANVTPEMIEHVLEILDDMYAREKLKAEKGGEG